MEARLPRPLGRLTVFFPLALLLHLFAVAPPSPAVAGDIITAGQSVNDSQTLVSAEGRFELGFFTPGRSKHRYLGIWYKRIPLSRVWVANRQRPLPDSTGVLAMSSNGSLILTDATSSVYWSADTGVASLGARLLDDGNLVVLGAGGGGGHVWQSFDFPADTLLPGMRLGVDLRSGLVRNITVWKSADDPAPGGFSLAIDPRGAPQLVLTNGTATRWRAGPWVGERFVGIPEMRANNVFKYGFISNENEVYFEFGVWNKSLPSIVMVNQSAVQLHYVWEEEGGYWRLLWHSPMGNCDWYGGCGPNSVCDVVGGQNPMCRCLEGHKPKGQEEELQWQPGTGGGGCTREASPVDCQKGKDEFAMVAGAKLPDTSAATVNLRVGVDECRAACRRNCSCTAFSSSDGGGCIAWFGDLVDLEVQASGQDLYVRTASGQGKKQRELVMVISVVLALASVFFLLTWMGLRVRRRRRRPTSKKRLTAMRRIGDNFHYDEITAANDVELTVFHLSTILEATENFAITNKLGEGGFGPVYKGKLHDGQAIAVKRLSTDSGQGLKEFKSEIGLVARLQHINLVRLLGYCIEAEEKILVYEYMPNLSLEKVIFDPTKGAELDWRKRFKIVEGIAQGLLYLHQYSRLRVIHRDLKASNILLDGEWNPKISDFGMARIFAQHDAQAKTRRIVGTYGYMPPEYAMKGLFSVKSDIFSFGILLLEIISGKKNTDTHFFGLSLNLSGHAWKLWRSGGRALELVDPSLEHSPSIDAEISRCVHVALLCVQEMPADRPKTVDVVSMLNNENVDLPAPNRPAYYFGRCQSVESLPSEREGLFSTAASASSELEAR